MKKNKIILFDLDGTLIDSTEAILESFDRAFSHFGVETPEDSVIKAEIGHPLDVMFVSLGVREELVWDYVAVYKAHYRKVSKAKTFLMYDAREAVEAASKIARLGVVTTKTGVFSIELLENMDLMHYFEVLVGREDVEYPKPHPEPIFKALSKLEGDTTDCWMIGDTCMDMDAALAAGVHGVSVTCGYASREELSKCAGVVTENALEAVAFISRS